MIHSILRYMRKHSPRAVMLENVPGLLSGHPEAFLEIMQAIRRMKDADGTPYRVSWKIVNSHTHGGLPQRRKRLYICAWRGAKMAWPRKIKPVPLRSIMDNLPKGPLGADMQLPTAPQARARVTKILKEIREASNYTTLLISTLTPARSGKP